jgi:hypothetical protein
MAASVPCTPLRRRPSVTFCVQVSPPTDLAQQVANFLEQEVPTVVKCKASLEITSDLAKKAFVDPAASMNETVRDYVARTNAVLPSEREKISVHIPEVWTDIRTRLNALEEESRIQKEESRILKEESRILKEESRVEKMRRYKLFAANTLADFIRKANSLKGTKKLTGLTVPVGEGSGKGFATSDRLRQAAANISEKDLKNWGLDAKKYKRVLGKTEQVSLTPCSTTLVHLHSADSST